MPSPPDEPENSARKNPEAIKWRENLDTPILKEINWSQAASTNLAPARKTSSDEIKFSNTQVFGVLGSIFLFIGVFLPIISAPIIGSVNYFQYDENDGVLILVMALISFVLVLMNKCKKLLYTGVGSLIIFAYTFVHFQIKMAELKDGMPGSVNV